MDKISKNIETINNIKERLISSSGIINAQYAEEIARRWARTY